MTCLDTFDLQVQETRVQKALPSFNLEISVATSVSAEKKKRKLVGEVIGSCDHRRRPRPTPATTRTSETQEKEAQDPVWGVLL